MRQFTSMRAHGSPLQLEAPQWPSYHPQSPLAVYHTAFLLQQRLESVSEQLYRQKSCSEILESILDFAQYWRRCSDEVKSNNRDLFQVSQKQKLAAEITIGEGLTRKIEIIVTPDFGCIYVGYITPTISSV